MIIPYVGPSTLVRKRTQRTRKLSPAKTVWFSMPVNENVFERAQFGLLFIVELDVAGVRENRRAWLLSLS